MTESRARDDHASGRPTHWEPTRLRRVGWWLTAGGLAAWTLLHVTLVVLSLLPWIGAPPALRDAASVYVEPIFPQTWSLFAPDPPAHERSAHVRGFYVESGESRTTPWLPLTEPLVRAMQENRLSSRYAASTVLFFAMYGLTDDEGLLALGPRIREQVIDGWIDLARRPTGLIVLERAGSAALAAKYPELELRHVQVRLTVRRLPAFAERESAGETSSDELVFRPTPFQDVATWSPDP